MTLPNLCKTVMMNLVDTLKSGLGLQSFQRWWSRPTFSVSNVSAIRLISQKHNFSSKKVFMLSHYLRIILRLIIHRLLQFSLQTLLPITSQNILFQVNWYIYCLPSKLVLLCMPLCSLFIYLLLWLSKSFFSLQEQLKS